MERKCRHRKLVVGEGCQVEECSRGTVHVVIGNMTLRMRPEAFLSVATALGMAANRLEGDGAIPGTVTRMLC